VNKEFSLSAILAVMALIGLAVSQYFIWVYAPLEQTMGVVQKIFYFHLPLAWWALFSFFLVFVASIVFLIKKDPKWDGLAGAAAESGVLLSALALITGSLWGRAAWNTWWTWDPRLTTTLVMWFVYCGYLVLRTAPINEQKRPKICAALGIVAFLDVPLVFFSARLWRSIHPAVFAARGGGLEPEMWHTVIVCIIAWGFLTLSIVGLRWRQIIIGQRISDLLRLEDGNSGN
jgi:heme exporter protein C